MIHENLIAVTAIWESKMSVQSRFYCNIFFLTEPDINSFT